VIDTGHVSVPAADEPRLCAALGAEVAEVQLSAGAEASLHVEGAALRRWFGGGRRAARLGLWGLRAITADELRLLIAGGDRAPLAWAASFFARNAWSAATALRRAGLPCTDLVAVLAAMERKWPASLRGDRFRAAPGAAASDLLTDAAASSRAVTALYVARVDAHLAALGQPFAPLGGAPASAELAFAEGIALQDAASDLAQRRSEQANELALHALDRLESALGAAHPLLVTALANAARAHARLGHPERARAPLDRALAIHRAQPDADPNETLRLETLLTRLA
jgi:hypothetical protein